MSEKGLKWEKIWTQVKSLQELTNKITNVIGDVVFLDVILLTLYYSVNLNKVFANDSSNWLGKISLFSLFIK